LYVLVCSLLVIPLCGIFYYSDARLLASWRAELLAKWVYGDIEFAAFRHALSGTPILPKETLRSMLDNLPISSTLVFEQSISSKTRRAVARIVLIIHTCRSDFLALRVGSSTIGVASLIYAVLSGSWYPMSFAGVFFLTPLLAKSARRFRLRGTEAAHVASLLDSNPSDPTFESLVLQLDWAPILATEKMRFIAAIGLAARSSRAAAP
jgi:hypothetical protein